MIVPAVIVPAVIVPAHLTRRIQIDRSPHFADPHVPESVHSYSASDRMSAPESHSPSQIISVSLPAGAVAEDLRPILASVHDDALRKRARQVTLDLRGAGPLGIAGLQHFVGWILEIQDLPPTERYTVHFIGDGGDHWQKRGLQALCACAESAISVSFVEGNA